MSAQKNRTNQLSNWILIDHQHHRYLFCFLPQQVGHLPQGEQPIFGDILQYKMQDTRFKLTICEPSPSSIIALDNAPFIMLDKLKSVCSIRKKTTLKQVFVIVKY